ncbi:hypothetical protein ACJJTC_006908 [Scirpophaga incertulas]
MDLPNQSTILNQNFGLCIGHQDILIPSYYEPGVNYYRPWRWGKQVIEDYGSTIQNVEDKFQIILDIQNFEPHEISVKLANNEVIIEGNHGEREDAFGCISRSFKRRYLLPQDCLNDSVESSVSSDGILVVTCLKNKTKEYKEITVPIQISTQKMNSSNKNELMHKSEDITELQCQTGNKKCTAVMLKEEHSCLLKPELLGKLEHTEGGGKISEDTKNNKILETSSKQETNTRKTHSSQIESTSIESASIEPSTSVSLNACSKIYDLSSQIKEADEIAIKGFSESITEKTSSHIESTMESVAPSNLNVCAKIYEIVSDDTQKESTEISQENVTKKYMTSQKASATEYTSMDSSALSGSNMSAQNQ